MGEKELHATVQLVSYTIKTNFPYGHKRSSSTKICSRGSQKFDYTITADCQCGNSTNCYCWRPVPPMQTHGDTCCEDGAKRNYVLLLLLTILDNTDIMFCTVLYGLMSGQTFTVSSMWPRH